MSLSDIKKQYGLDENVEPSNSESHIIPLTENEANFVHGGSEGDDGGRTGTQTIGDGTQSRII